MIEPLKQIDHIIVLMLENRSFDQMLGYLRLEESRGDVDGLQGTERNLYKGVSYAPQRFTGTAFNLDPHHDWDNVHQQLNNTNGGFIENFATVTTIAPQQIMNYHNKDHVQTLDFLARNYCVCDRWFSSVPGPTQPNRVYSLAGHSNGRKNNLSIAGLLGGWDVKPIFEFLPDNVTWRYFSHDIASLRYIKGYMGHVEEIDKVDKFYTRAQEGTLPNVSWIDPDFNIPPFIYPGPPNDDHPPHDIRNGQLLVKKVYNALVNGPREQWEKSLLVVVYDEHGGFYDHVSPRQWIPADDRAEFRQYGVRVPAILISPWVGKQISIGSQQNMVFDHTSILRTILRRFCSNADGSIPGMTARVDAANDLSHFLTEKQPRSDGFPAPDFLFENVWHDQFLLTETKGELVKEMKLVRRKPSELQQSLEILANKAISQGVSPDKL
ncbi:MAG: alkaline phosphatase family protein [Pyrinomonadaceae bacterium]